MAAVRPVLTVYKLNGEKAAQVKTPAVFTAPIRKDVVHFVHTNMAKNRRQAYAVKRFAGLGYSAVSWGTGRAVARVPRICGGGTSRSGQGAFANQCRGGQRFQPTKIWRRWHRKLSKNVKRYAVAAALAASAVSSLVMARGHAIGNVREIPFVVENEIESIRKTKAAVAALKTVGADADVIRAKNTRNIRTGVSKLRGRAHTGRKGPLIVFANDNGITRAFRNLPGVELANVKDLNLLKLAPGGTIGRFIIWTAGAVAELNNVFGTTTTPSKQKAGYTLPYAPVTNADIDRIINSNEIQSKLRAPKKTYAYVQRHNPLTNFAAKVALNPYALFARRAEVAKQAATAAFKKTQLEAARAGKPVPLSASQIKKRAQKLATRKLSKMNYKRSVLGQHISAEETRASQFNMETYKKAMKATVKGASPKAFDIATYKVPAAVTKKVEHAAKIAAAVAKKNIAGRQYYAKQAKVKAAAAAKAATGAKKK